jgi:hypothetical protein
MIHLLRDLVASIGIWFVKPKCPFCLQRTSNPEAHVHIDHAGDDRLVKRRRS